MAGDCDPAQISALVEAHKQFEPFVGTFKAEVRLWMFPGEPNVSTGVMTNSLELGGRFLRQVYQGDPTDGPFPDFEGRGFWGYNTVTNKYEGFWIDNASTIMMTEIGDVDDSGRIWTMRGEFPDPQTGKPTQRRSVITLQDNDHHTMEMYMTGPDGREVKTMEITYQRASRWLAGDLGARSVGAEHGPRVVLANVSALCLSERIGMLGRARI